MCVPGCSKVVADRLSRRSFFRSTLIAGASVAVAGCAKTAPRAAADTTAGAAVRQFSRVVDLTHTLSETFPTYGGKQLFSRERFSTLAKGGFNSFTWTLFEHIGTHIDAPVHFSDKRSVDEIPVEELVIPLAVIDIQAKAAANPDSELTVDDIKAFEAKFGPIPAGACVAMNSGWWKKVNTKQFSNVDAKGGMHFPGFHHEAALYLAERKAAGIAVDTLSLDPGNSKDFSTHVDWLSSNHWGLECLANLGDLPPIGATLVVGAPKVLGATGGPSRVMALL